MSLEWHRKKADIFWTGTNGQELVGDFDALLPGKALPLNANRTWITRGNADDGGIALPVNQAYLFGSRRMLLTYAQSGNISAFGGQDRLSVNADESNMSGIAAGHWGMLELKASGKSSPTMGAVRGDINAQTSSTISAGSVVSCFLAACEALSASTHTGKYAVLHVPNPQAGTFDYFAVFGDTTGLTTGSSAKNGLTPTLWLNVHVGATDYFIPLCS